MNITAAKKVTLKLTGWLRRQDPGFLVVVVLCLVALWPFLSRPDLPMATDAELHIFRLGELSGLIRAGEIYPRWAPNFYYGYGYPIFNYYAPLSYYVGLIFELLPRLDAVAAVKIVFMLSLLGGAVGLYGYARDLWGRAAGYVAAVLFAYAPYIQYVDPHARGDLAESLSFGLFPLALWRAHRFWQGRRWWDGVLTAVLTAAVILSHNLMAMVFFALLLGWAAWQIVADWRVATWTRRSALLFSLGLGVGMAAFFWVPVALERAAVDLGTLVGDGAGDHFDFRNHFLTLSTLFGPSKILDWGASEPEITLNLGLMQWLVGGLGIILLNMRQAPGPRPARFWSIVAVGLILMMLPLSQPIWEIVPLLPFLQFPWRLLGPAVIALALLGGGATATLVRMRPAWRAWPAPALAAMTIVLALPLTLVPPWAEDFGQVNATEAIYVELTGRWLGTTATSDFLPVTVEVLPKPVGPVLEDYFTGRPVDRVNRAALPAGTTVETEYLRPLHTRYQVDGAKAFPLRLFLFDFPGWEATVDGQRVATELGRPEGFLVVPVPAGSHQVDVRFGSTPPRRLAAAISLVSLLIMAGAAWWWRKRQLPTPSMVVNVAEASDGRLLILGVSALLLLATVIEPAGWLHAASTGYVAEPAQFDVSANFGDQIRLIGYDIPDGPFAAGDVVPIALYWKAQTDLDINFQVFVHLIGPDGRLAAQSDKLNPGEFPTKRWSLDKYVRDAHQLQLPPDLPAGAYQLQVGLWVQTEGWRLPIFDETGRQIGDSFSVTPIAVDRARGRD